MMERLAHRGPDGHGMAELPGRAGVFGHVRLAIIDPNGGLQPLWTADRRCVIAFNGEIYNYRQLRAELAADGIVLRTQSDTEVVMELLRRDGPKALARLRGMFALAFWDADRGKGLLARDRFGIKPLFLRQDRDRLWFASEAKAFTASPIWQPVLDCQRLHLLLNLRYPAGGEGLMRGVTQLGPGQCLTWSRDGVSTSTFADQPDAQDPPQGLRTMVMDSVRAHLVADVPVACYLSGGLDSGIVAYAATRLANDPIESFTIDAGDDPLEMDNARQTSRWLGIPNTAGVLNPTTPAILDWLLWHLEVPKINALQSAAVAQLAARHAKVCLSGLGSDELFLGYRAHSHLASWHRASTWLGPLAAPLGRCTAAILANGRAGFGERRRAALMLAQAGHAARAYGLLRNVWDGSVSRETIYGPRMLDQPLPQALDWIEQRWPVGLSPVDAMAEFEWRNKMVDDLLWQEDRVSMAFGLEVRVPFVDALLARALGPTPIQHRGRPGHKDELRRAFAGELPGFLLRRPKSGFQIDIPTHFDALFGPVLSEWLSAERVRHHGLFAPGFVARLRSLPRQRGHRWHLFMLLLMALSHRWIELFEQGQPPPTTPPAIVGAMH